MDHVQIRPLAPRLGPPPPPHPPPDESKKRKRTAIACKPCRERKTACNSVRPTCAACEARHTDCYYLTKNESETKLQALRRENKNLNDLIEHLRTESDDVALSILQQLRGSVNPASILEDIENGSLSVVQPSQRETALASLPTVHSETEFRLMVDHSVAYPALDLSRDAIMAKNTLLDSAKVLARDLPSASTRHKPAVSTSKAAIAYSPGTHALDDNPDEILKAQAKPNVETDGDAQHHIDPALNELKIAFWTTQAYTSKDPEAATKSFEFEREAELLWRVEKIDSILATAGLMLLFLSHGGHASQREGEFVQEASDMAKRMKLFGVKTVLDGEQIKSLSPEAQRALSHTTWGVFNLYM
ncbi:hypothetical protein N0V90_012604 [Kalmusia sp. IMI 367209]|nr:hypothetical protein N0V90_012604 [Kalmusia sp. IMI 367209]